MNVVVLTMAATWVSPRFASGLFWFSVPSLFPVDMDMDKVFLDLFIESTSGFIVFCSLFSIS